MPGDFRPRGFSSTDEEFAVCDELSAELGEVVAGELGGLLLEDGDDVALEEFCAGTERDWVGLRGDQGAACCFEEVYGFRYSAERRGGEVRYQ